MPVNNPENPEVFNTMAMGHIPTMTQFMSVPNAPLAVHLALDARAAEKRALLDLSDELVQNLRPDIERLTADLVQKTLAGVWEKRSSLYRDT